MAETINEQQGYDSLKGGIHNQTTTGIFCACTATQSRTYKTYKGAVRFLEKEGYKKFDTHVKNVLTNKLYTISEYHQYTQILYSEHIDECEMMGHDPMSKDSYIDYISLDKELVKGTVVDGCFIKSE